MVKDALRAADVARSGLADAALGPAGDVDVARAHDADLGGAGGVRFDVAGSRDRHFHRIRLDPARVDPARAGNFIFGGARFAASSLGVARSGDRQLQRLYVERADAEPARARDLALEAVALNLVDID